jgi:hypothetical protein
MVVNGSQSASESTVEILIGALRFTPDAAVTAFRGGFNDFAQSSALDEFVTGL